MNTLLSSHIDGLAFTFNPKCPVTEKQIILNCQNLVSANQGIIVKNGRRYALTFCIPLLSKPTFGLNSHLYVQVSSKYRSFMRIEFKGLPYTRKMWFEVSQWLSQIMPNRQYYEIISKVKLTKVHWALDLKKDIKDLSFNFSKSRKSGVFSNSSGLPETFYFGGKESALQLCIYNKKVQMPSYPHEGSVTRVEFRFKKLNHNLIDLMSIEKFPNEAKRIEFFDAAELRSLGFSYEEVDYITRYSIKPYLQRRDRVERRRVMMKLDTIKIDLLENMNWKLLWQEAAQDVQFMFRKLRATEKVIKKCEAVNKLISTD